MIGKIHAGASPESVRQAIAQADAGELREWLARNWTPGFLDASPAVVRMLLPYLDLAHVPGRASLVLYAVDHDWAEVLPRADEPECGFLPAFWRNAFTRAQAAGSMQCRAWLLDRKRDAIGALGDTGLEL